MTTMTTMTTGPGDPPWSVEVFPARGRGYRAALLAVEAGLEPAERRDARTLRDLTRSARVSVQVVRDSFGAPVGYAIWHDDAGTLELRRLAVGVAARRRGVGRLLVDDFVARPGRCRAEAWAQVAERDLAAQLFLRACRFRVPAARGIRRPDGPAGEAVYIFRRLVTAPFPACAV